VDAKQLVDYAKSLDCVHCGLCLRACPTYRLSGRESASPRGRIHMMRSIAEGQSESDASFVDELDFCLLCRNCESVCPSGVHYAEMVEHTRAALFHSPARSGLGGFALRFGLRQILTRRNAISFLAALLRTAQRIGFFEFAGDAFGAPGRAMARFPRVPPAGERGPLPAVSPAIGERRATVAVLEGCVMPALLGRVNRATVTVLRAAGCEVRCPREPVCCGSLHAHNGDRVTAISLAKQMIVAYDAIEDESGEPVPVVVNSAGCSAHMKAYGELLGAEPQWRERAAAFSARVFDFAEYLVEHALPDLLPQLDSPREVATPLCFDDPCHLCHAQGIRQEPRELLDALGLERVELEESESCCGSAGLYSVLRPEDSQGILEERLEALRRSGARTLVTANPGCQLQWESGVRSAQLEVEVRHLAEVLEGAIGNRVSPRD